jgi:lysophospholipase L1-like esterase
MLKYLFRFLIFIVVFAGLTEIILRYKFGFCNAPLYVNDPDFEYIYAPNQEVTRFGNLIRTNSLSMRSEEIAESDSIVILLVGDSVINGGSLTDHDNIGSTMLEKRFLKEFKKKVRVLNISAGSWGPDNIAAYLKKNGLFNAKLICLVTSSHDAHDIMYMYGPSPVGIDPGMPDKQYKVALVELWEKYHMIIYWHILSFMPDFTSDEELKQETDQVVQGVPDSLQKDSVKTMELNQAGIRKSGIGFNPGYEQLYEMAKADSIPFFIYLHPEISEVEAGNFNDQGQEIIRFAKEKHIRLINEFNLGINLKYYRNLDVVHYNDDGQVFLANNLYPLFADYLKNNN